MPTMSPLATYLTRLNTLAANPYATAELSLRPAMGELFDALAPKNIEIAGEGKKLAPGRPDFTFSRLPLGDAFGFVEAEKMSADLDNLKDHAKHQNDAFKSDFDNFLLSNHLDFRLYDGGKPVDAVVLPASASKLTAKHETDFMRLWERFIRAAVPAPKTAKELAVLLARRAKALRFNIGAALETPDSPLHKDLAAFRRLLLPDLTASDFANLYAETLAYGLFAARCQHVGEGRFSVESAPKDLRRTPLLRTLYRLFEDDIDPNLRWILDAMAAILNGAAIDDIRDYFQNRAGRRDPMIDFYEPFLAQYDARARQARGVYYTPEPVVSFIVRGVHDLLRTRFGMSDGLAGGAKILDPATGTGSFLFAVVDEMHRAIGKDDWPSFVKSKKPLADLFGFEILVAPYTVAHLKLALQLEGLGTPLGPDERLNIFLSNTLYDARYQREAVLESAISDEVNAAADVKEKTKILVVLGNPPYAGHSSNSGTRLMGDERVFTAVGKQIESYKSIDGVPLGERNSKYLQDDYVKFLAFAQKRVEKSGEGIVAFITNNGYLDNPTFRGMRHSFMQTFSTIYLLDLHGNSKKKEVAPDGSADNNVFDIQAGVSIILAVKEKGRSGTAEVFHSELWGARADKYDILNDTSIKTTTWQKLQPSAPMFFFVPRDEELLPTYEEGWKITDILPVNTTGAKTHRDNFALAFTEEQLRDNITAFTNSALSDEQVGEQLGLIDTGDWDLSEARAALKAAGDVSGAFTRMLYRPFDVRHYFNNPIVVTRPRTVIMSHMLKPNLGLIATRQTRDQFDVLATKYICGHKSCAVYDINSLFPLYLYSNGMFGEEKRANIAADYLSALGAIGIEAPAPEDVFGYIYAVLHAPTYRARYGAFLKTDFPRVPLPASPAAFASLAALGRELVARHTLDFEAAPSLRDKRHALSAGGDAVVKPFYDAAKRQLHISDAQWFADVAPETATFKIGGYVVADKWLSDRRGRTLSFDERRLFPSILNALDDTRRLMAEIDALFAA